MQLTYRSVSYQSKLSSVEISQQNILGKYRGISYSIQSASEIIPEYMVGLKYRGVVYLNIAKFLKNVITY